MRSNDILDIPFTMTYFPAAMNLKDLFHLGSESSLKILARKIFVSQYITVRIVRDDGPYAQCVLSML